MPIELKKISYQYPIRGNESIRALNNISLSIDKGEMVAVIGANGSGKTTLTMLLNGVFLPDKGKVIVDGDLTSDVKTNRLIRRKVGVIFQNPTEQIVSGTVEKDIAFSLENHGIEPKIIAQKVESSIERFGLGDIRFRHPRGLSGGEQQMVAFAGIWALDPDYFICDEVTTFLDSEHRQNVLSLLREEANSDSGVLFITQYPEEAISADRLIILSEGKIVAEDEPLKILSDQKIMNKSNHRVPEKIYFEKLISESKVLS